MTACPHAYGAFYRWLIFIGIVVSGGFVAVFNQLFATLLDADRSYLSVVILGLFVVTSGDAGRRAYRLGSELCSAMQLTERAKSGQPLFTVSDDQRVHLAAPHEHGAYAQQHLLMLANKIFQQGNLCGQELLLERLENSVGRGHETGWFLADLMIRLGLLGTVIGFIFMLGSVAHVSSLDIHALQQLLTNMSGGMRIALYTTLTGLSAGILLGFQYRLLDSAVDHLMAEIIELSEVHVTPHLRSLLGN